VEFRGQGNLALIESGTDLVTDFLGRQDLLNGQVTGLVDDQIDRFFLELGKLFVLAQFTDFELFVQDKVHIPSICDHLCHVFLLVFSHVNNA
jgi:hypothetical protein